MTRKRLAQIDPLECEIERALRPGAFISDHVCFTFVDGLDAVEAKIAKLRDTDPVRAVSLYESFLAGCHEKAEEVDDSSGSFGQFAGQLFCAWTTARQASGADPDETATRLLGWMDDDPYGFCHRLEQDLAQVFDKAGLAAFVKLVRARFDSALERPPKAAGSYTASPDYLRRHWGEVLRALYAAQQDLTAYVALAQDTGLTAQDCHTIGKLLAARRRSGEALDWAERGIDLARQTPHGSMADHDLVQLKRELLIKLGRRNEATDAAWANYREHPGKYTYNDLMKSVPKAERKAWHERAIEAAETADLDSRFELLWETKELARLADLVRRTEDSALESLSHYTTEPVAQKFEKSHADLAARLWKAQGMRILNAKKSKYYGAALSNFESAKRCFKRAGPDAEWQKTVSQVRVEHHRKIGFMSGFDRLVGGMGPSDEPSFLERAKRRWNKP